MLFIVFVLGCLTLGSFLWTIIQIIKPQIFFKAEDSANMTGERPKWYLIGGLAGIVVLLGLWYQAFSIQHTSVWILTIFFTLASIKPIGIVFFYDKFSSQATNLVEKMSSSKTVYWAIVASRAVLTVILFSSTLYFYNLGQVL